MFSRSYAGESDMVKSSGNGTALLDASLANDAHEDWDEAQEDDSGALLRKQKPVMQQQNFENFSMVSYKEILPLGMCMRDRI